MRKDYKIFSWNPAWAADGPTSVSPSCWPRGRAAQTAGPAGPPGPKMGCALPQLGTQQAENIDKNDNFFWQFLALGLTRLTATCHLYILCLDSDFCDDSSYSFVKGRRFVRYTKLSIVEFYVERTVSDKGFLKSILRSILSRAEIQFQIH